MQFQNVALYVRVSTELQGEGYSIEQQIDRLKKYTASKDWYIYNIYTDLGYSGSNIDRPSLQKLISDIKNNKIDLVLVYKLDRLSRSQKDTLYLIEEIFLPNKVDFISITENFDTSSPFGKAMIGILSVFAQLERENIKNRLALGHIGRAKAGYWRAGSNPPIGYDYIDGKLKINEYEALQIRTIFEKFIQGNSIYSITQYMRQNYTNKYSSYKDSSQTGVILKNRLYIGKIKYKGVEYDGVHTPIIDINTFNKAQEHFKEIKKNMSTHYLSPYHRKHILSGLLFCGNCGARYFATTTRTLDKTSGKYTRSSTNYCYYKCYTRDGNKQMKKADYCKNPTYRSDYLEDVILFKIINLSVNKDHLRRLLNKNNNSSVKYDIVVLEKEIIEIDKKITKLMDLYTLDSIPISEISDRIKPLYKKKNQLIKQKENLLNNMEVRRSKQRSFEEILAIIQLLSENIMTSNVPMIMQLVQSLVEKIEVLPKKDDFKIYWNF